MRVVANSLYQTRSQRIRDDISSNAPNIVILSGSAIVIRSLPETSVLTPVAVDVKC
jgi:hypothetical protein